MIKECRNFAGMVNFVRIFCPELQGLLKPIYDLTRKGRLFVWGEEQQKAFEEIKVDYIDLQFYTCQIDKDDSSYIQTLVSLPLVVLYTNFRMDSLNSLPT